MENNGNGHDKTEKLRVIRRRIDLKKRQAILRRDYFKCVFCGKGPQQTILHVDHKKPWTDCVKEGIAPDGMDNLQTICEPCNQGKLNYWDDSLDAPILKQDISENQLGFDFNSQEKYFVYMNKQNDLYKKYDLFPKWPIRQLEKPDFPLQPDYLWTLQKPDLWPVWVIDYPNGQSLIELTLERAERRRLIEQYSAKYSHGNMCWYPNDIYPG